MTATSDPRRLRPICPSCGDPVDRAGNVCLSCARLDDDGCPVNDPACEGRADDCHATCESGGAA